MTHPLSEQTSAVGPRAGGAGWGGMIDDYCTQLASKHWRDRAGAIAALRTPEDVATRQRLIRETVLRGIGGFPAERTPLNARLTGTLERDGYRVEKLIFESRPRFYVTANVYVPTGIPGPFPAVLGCMGHYEEGKAFEEAQRLYIGLAKRGFLVLTYDPPDQGERKGYLDPATGQPLLATCPEGHTMAGLQSLLIGRNFAHYELWDGICAVDYLAARSDVDAQRIGAIGNSGGGTQSSYLAVVEPRLAAVAPCCYITSWEQLWTRLGPQDAEQNFVDGIKDGLDYPDYLIAFAPKPFLILSATRDFFPIEGARATHAEAKRIYAILGSAERAGFFEYDDGHSWSKPKREATYAWMERWLMGRAESAPEPEFEIEPIDRLNCTPTGQVLTSLHGLTVQELAVAEAQEIYPRRRAATPAGAAQLPELIMRRLKITRPEAAPRVESRGMVQREGYRIERVILEPEPGIKLPTWILVPDRSAGPAPAVIAVSEAGKSGAIVPGGELERRVREGCVVVAPDLRGLGETRTSRPLVVYGDLYDPDMRALLVGKTLAGMQVGDLLSVLAYAVSRPEIDGDRIALTGDGTAGIVALLAAALEPRIASVVISGALSSFMDFMRVKIHEGMMDLVIPGVLHDFDIPDVVEYVGTFKVTLVKPKIF